MLLEGLMKKIFGDPNEKELKKIARSIGEKKRSSEIERIWENNHSS